ncbi:UNKNOWN [Stylonychia lemnae]|uniref:TRP C-terminal domain-containing protein n=1 Tax=Stylonychia lemnae TaxID=5949 RepID=A0A078AGB3_STYLE|nr:UNKNOWN [Stylonychia lemnae]|eukprot:CDW80557.1 UNKNOWN [Stylonychia lemnae]
MIQYTYSIGFSTLNLRTEDILFLSGFTKLCLSQTQSQFQKSYINPAAIFVQTKKSYSQNLFQGEKNLVRISSNKSSDVGDYSLIIMIFNQYNQQLIQTKNIQIVIFDDIEDSIKILQQFHPKPNKTVSVNDNSSSKVEVIEAKVSSNSTNKIESYPNDNDNKIEEKSKVSKPNYQYDQNNDNNDDDDYSNFPQYKINSKKEFLYPPVIGWKENMTINLTKGEVVKLHYPFQSYQNKKWLKMHTIINHTLEYCDSTKELYKDSFSIFQDYVFLTGAYDFLVEIVIESIKEKTNQLYINENLYTQSTSNLKQYTMTLEITKPEEIINKKTQKLLSNLVKKQVKLLINTKSLQYLWSYLNTIQILGFMPLIGFDMPDFLVIFFQNINKFNFMMIDMGDYLTDKLDLRPFLIKIKLLKEYILLKKFADKMNKLMKYQLIICLINSTFLNILTGGLLNLLAFNFQTNGEGFSSILSLIITAILFFYLMLTVIYLVRYKNKLDDPQIEQKYGELYDGLKLKGDKHEQLYNQLIMLRRFLFTIFVFVFQDYNLIKYCLCVVYLGCFFFIYVAYLNPLENRIQNGLEIYNQLIVFLCFLFSAPMVMNDSHQDDSNSDIVVFSAYIIVGLFVMLGAMNILYQVIQVVKSLRSSYKKWKLKKKKQNQVVHFDENTQKISNSSIKTNEELTNRIVDDDYSNRIPDSLKRLKSISIGNEDEKQKENLNDSGKNESIDLSKLYNSFENHQDVKQNNRIRISNQVRGSILKVSIQAQLQDEIKEATEEYIITDTINKNSNAHYLLEENHKPVQADTKIQKLKKLKGKQKSLKSKKKNIKIKIPSESPYDKQSQGSTSKNLKTPKKITDFTQMK